MIERQVTDDIDGNARRGAVDLETRLALVAASLDALASQGVASCSPADLEKLRGASFVTSPAKEFSVIGPDGDTLCTDLGLSLGAREVVSVQRAALPASSFLTLFEAVDPVTVAPAAREGARGHRVA